MCSRWRIRRGENIAAQRQADFIQDQQNMGGEFAPDRLAESTSRVEKIRAGRYPSVKSA